MRRGPLGTVAIQLTPREPVSHQDVHPADHRDARPAGRLDCSTIRSCVPSRRQSRVAFQRVPQFVTRAQQYDAHKSAPHAQLIGNFVVAHIRVIAHHQRHARPFAQAGQRLAYFRAAALFDQAIELAGIGMFERQLIAILGFLILADLAAAQGIPAMISRTL